ncbi:MAG: XRE family transcriptional regulator [Lawsonibacter sp.]|nr:XRE family transcriptional regulator [Lawsonibacter sp.]
MQILKSLRAEKKWTQQDVATKLGIDRTTYAKYESGASEPNFEMLGKLTKIFGIPTDYLLGRSSGSNSGGRLVPILGDVAAGIPIEAIQDIVDYEEIDMALASTGEFFGLRLKGASMESRMRDGDIVIIRKQDDADTGDTVVALVNGDSATVKRIKKEPSGISLIPNNPAYDTMFYSYDEIKRLPVQIIGKVVELRAKF